MFCRGYVEPKLNLGRDSEARFGQFFEFQVKSRDLCLVHILKCLVDILKMKFDQDLRLNCAL